MNLFDRNEAAEDFQYLLDQAGIDILINNHPSKALITTPLLNRIIDYDDRMVSTLDTIKRGDLVTYNDKPFMVITETEAKRNVTYKSIMRHCNYTIEIPGGTELVYIGDDWRGFPIYEERVTEWIDFPVIADNRKFDITGNEAINIPENQVIITVQNNEDTRDFSINDTFNVMGSEWNIIDVDKTKVGLLIWTAERI
ncbi:MULTISPECIES: Ig domain-containing protein [Bacillaceae]|uniref:Ig domain-containing protein n=1 Tax=Evansella alkalicola TaxID=745819 RepID=A0ABS6JTS3_9BACI|nr:MULTISPECIES: Ig domain-containing protein [Bacillaceae]MBU9720540.1 Ig domain-containing protein [Bacillus alkalicola]